MVQINWTAQSKSDLNMIYNYISLDSRTYAKRLVVKIKTRTHILREFIYAGRIVPEFELESIRELILGNYRIVYRVVSDNRCDILTIHHSARDLNKRKDLI